MIQRIQSVYLLLAALLVLAVPFVGGIVTPDSWAWFAPVKLAVSILVALGCVATIFLFKDRARQKRLVMVDMTLAFGLAVLLVFAVVTTGWGASAGWPVGLTVVAVVCLFLARRSISKDIELVRSMDRLR